MATEAFRSTRFREDSLRRIGEINDILAEYSGQKLTVRQVFYQLVSRGLIPNTVKSYKNTASIITDGRYAGLIDWEVIEDRNREPDSPSEWVSIDSLVNAALRSFRLPRWEGQEYYVEVWVEKAALAGVLSPITYRHHVTLMVNRGYSSASAMKESAERMMFHCSDDERRPILLYLGDHDPSGEDMVRDVRDRLIEFGVERLEVHKLALTMDQIKKFRPPPNPAKWTDSRAAAYVEKFGEQSWELDALPPRELNRIVEEAILEYLDQEK